MSHLLINTRLNTPSSVAALVAALALAIGGCSSNPEAPRAPATAMSAVAGTTPQTATVGTLVPIAPAVKVSDAGGAGYAGLAVTFTVIGAGGSVTSSPAVTNSSGLATVGGWTLGPIAGPNTLIASVPSVPSLSRVTFTSTGTPGAAVTLTVAPASAALLPTEAQQLTVAGVDKFGNAIPSSAISFLSPGTAVATVSTSGLVSAVAAGRTTITVSSGSASVPVPVSVLTVLQTTEGGQPWGVAASANNVVYVTEFSAAQLGRYDLPSISLSSSTVALPGHRPLDVTFLPDGSKAYVADQGLTSIGEIGVINVATNTQTAAIALPDDPYRVLASPDGSIVYATTREGDLVKITTATNTATTTVMAGSELNGLAFHPTLPRVYVSSTSGAAYEVDVTTNTVTRTFTIGGGPQGMQVSADGSKLYIANEFGTLDVYSTASLSRLSFAPDATGAFGLAITKDGAQLYLTRPSTGTVMIVDRASLIVLKTISVGGSPRRIAFDAAGTTAIIPNESGYVTFIH